MSDDIVRGDTELIAKLNGLSDRMGKNILRKAVRAGCAPIIKDARLNVPVKEGALKRGLIRKIRTYPDSVVGVIGGTTDNIDGQIPANIAHLVEYGTAPHKDKGGIHPGAMAQPFLRPAYDAQKGAAENAIAEKIKTELEKEANAGR